MVARFQLLDAAPETISLALAEYWLTSTTSGRSQSSSTADGGDQRRLRSRFAAGVGLGADDGSFGEEFIRHIGRRREQAAGVVAKIHNDRLGILLFHFLVDGFVDLVAGTLA